MRWLAILFVSALSAVAAADQPSVTPALVATGKAIYEGSAAGCFACHGSTVEPPPRNFVRDPVEGGERLDQAYVLTFRPHQ